MHVYLRRHVKNLVKKLDDGSWHVHPLLFEDEPTVCFTLCRTRWSQDQIREYCLAHAGQFTIPGAVEVLDSHFQTSRFPLPTLVPEGQTKYRDLHCESPTQPEQIRNDLAELVQIALDEGLVQAVPRLKR